MADVEDKDRGWRNLAKAVAAADGLELRVGLLNWGLRYPKDAGATEIAKVAGIHKVYNAVVEGYDANRSLVETAFARLHKRLLAGKTGTADWIYRNMGIPLRDDIRERAMRIVTMRTGRMRESFRATVFDNVKPGRRGPMHTGEVAAGDSPLEPKASKKIS